MDNEERAGRFQMMLNKYRSYIDDADEESLLTDILTDARHWCAAHDVDFETKLITSEYNFNEERGEAHATK